MKTIAGLLLVILFMNANLAAQSLELHGGLFIPGGSLKNLVGTGTALSISYIPATIDARIRIFPALSASYWRTTHSRSPFVYEVQMAELGWQVYVPVLKVDPFMVSIGAGVSLNWFTASTSTNIIEPRYAFPNPGYVVGLHCTTFDGGVADFVLIANYKARTFSTRSDRFNYGGFEIAIGYRFATIGGR